jgi:hypothetical protein
MITCAQLSKVKPCLPLFVSYPLPIHSFCSPASLHALLITKAFCYNAHNGHYLFLDPVPVVCLIQLPVLLLLP